MFEFFLAPLLLLAVPFLIHHPFWLAFLCLLLAPGVYAMCTGAPFVPTSRSTMAKMFTLADIKPHERVYDLGCGDGRLVFEAAKKGAHATGYELSPPIYLSAKIRALFHPRSHIFYRDFWRQNIGDADVVFCYLLTDSMQTFKQKMWPTLKPGTRVVSHAFAMNGIEPVNQMGDVRLYVR